jgi:hypothetical protein
MSISLLLVAQLFIGIIKRLVTDTYYQALGVLVLLVLVVGTVFSWLVVKLSFLNAIVYAVTTMSMNTPYAGLAGTEAALAMKIFHVGYTFLSVGIFIVFATETGKTMAAAHEETMKNLTKGKVKPAAGKPSANSR